MSNTAVHSVSVVIPVYGGSATLQQVVNELSSFYSEQVSEGGNRYQVAEVILVDDCGVDNSAKVIRELAKVDERVVPVWLTRNYGQHAATVAGMASSSHEWVVTMDEDGQHFGRFTKPASKLGWWVYSYSPTLRAMPSKCEASCTRSWIAS